MDVHRPKEMSTSSQTGCADAQHEDAQGCPVNLEHARRVTEEVVRHCVAVQGRCVFSSEEAMIQCVGDLANEVDATVHAAWQEAGCFVSAEEPLQHKLSADPQYQRPNDSETAPRGIFPALSLPPTLSSLLNLAVVSPAQWTTQRVWTLASWVARDVVGWQPHGTEKTEAPTGQVCPTISCKQRSTGVIFLPALHGLCLRVLNDLAAHHPYHTVLTMNMWDDYLLQSLRIRNGPEVTEFLLGLGRMVAVRDGAGIVCGIVLDSVMELNEKTVQGILKWISMMEKTNNTLIRWENRLVDLEDLLRLGEHADDAATDMENISLLHSAIDEYKLVQIQMMKLHNGLLDSGAEVTLEDCLRKWDTMMENFPQADALIELSKRL